VVTDEVVAGARGEAEDAAGEEACEYEGVLAGGGAVERAEVGEEQAGGDEEGEGAEEVAVDIDGFIVQVEEAEQSDRNRIQLILRHMPRGGRPERV
jgi:hypothetical protein